MPTELRVTTEQRGDWSIVRAEGEIDIASVPELEAQIEEVLEAGADRIVFDLEPVSFMDSTGLRVILSSHNRLEAEGGGIALVVGNGPVLRLLQVSGLEDSLSIYRSIDDVV